MITEDQIVETAREWLGTKFHHQGRRKGVGVDCIGLIVGVAEQLGLSVIDKTGYSREPRNCDLQRELEQQLALSGLKVGCIGLFRIDKDPQHVGIITQYGAGFGLIHAYAQTRKVVEHNLDASWKEKLVSCYSFPLE